jgi:hypothetical protein
MSNKGAAVSISPADRECVSGFRLETRESTRTGAMRFISVGLEWSETFRPFQWREGLKTIRALQFCFDIRELRVLRGLMRQTGSVAPGAC